ncbi:MAG: class I SAM-dependent methyltransferase [Oryzihumus sp.]
MLRELRRRARDAAVRAVAAGTVPLREDVAGLQMQLAETQQRLEHLRHQMQHVERRNLSLAADRIAVESSAAWAMEHLPRTPTFPDKAATLGHAMAHAPAEGLVLEFGVWTGSTLRAIVESLPGHEVFGFDSFQGLPEDWRTGFPAGMFGVDGLPQVPGAELVVGWFDQTLPGFLAGHPGPVAFLHVDCDLYSSTTTVLDAVGPRLVPGSVIVFDEYFNYPGWQGGEHRAWQEYVERTGTRFSWLGYTLEDEQVAVQVTSVG